jgi:SAM-dependent methyltransferase
VSIPQQRFLTDRREDVHRSQPWMPFAYVGRKLRQAVVELMEGASLRPGDRVLDHGCGQRPYRAELPPGVEYVGADLPGNPDADVDLAPDGRVPLAEESFDLVLSNQVLEHVEHLTPYLSECYRLLRPGGSLVLSTHGIMYYHRDPEDYWRWTQPGLTKLLTDHGFDVVEARGVLGLAAAALQIFQDATSWKLPRLLQRMYVVVMQLTITFVDGRYSPAARVDNCLTIAVRAVKPGDRAHGDG